MEPFVVGFVLFEAVDIFSAVVFYLFSSDIQKEQLGDRPDVVKLLQSGYFFITERKTNPRHRLRETFIILLDLIESDIYDLDPLFFKIDLLVKFLKKRGERFADVALS